MRQDREDTNRKGHRRCPIQETTVKTINGMTEVEYLMGALRVLETEYSTSHNQLEVMERILMIQSCIITALRGE